MGSETWRRCKIGLFRPEEIRSLQNNKSAATQSSCYILLKDFTDDNIGHPVIDYHPFYGVQYGWYPTCVSVSGNCNLRREQI